MRIGAGESLAVLFVSLTSRKGAAMDQHYRWPSIAWVIWSESRPTKVRSSVDGLILRSPRAFSGAASSRFGAGLASPRDARLSARSTALTAAMSGSCAAPPPLKDLVCRIVVTRVETGDTDLLACPQQVGQDRTLVATLRQVPNDPSA